ncbi:hypothetical protein QJQ45_011733 [Haematococcus lacustris]|nr:hypothetical protein QJQ45_011733 [Haematococcus lacustris]
MKLGKQRGATKARPPGHASVPTHARVAAKGAIQSERKRSETIEDAHYRKALQRMECGPDDGNLSDSSNDTSEHTQPPSKAVASRRPAKGTAVQEPQTHENSIDSDQEGGLGQQAAARRQRAVPSSIPGAQPVRVKSAAAPTAGDDEEEADAGDDEDDKPAKLRSQALLQEQQLLTKPSHRHAVPLADCEQVEELPFEERLLARSDGVGPAQEQAKAAAKAAKQQEASFKRANKHRPKEMSSKRPVSRAREVVAPVRKEGKDPRFEPSRPGEKEAAARRYAFLYDSVMPSERAVLRTAMKAERNPQTKAALSLQLQRLDSRLQQERTRRQRSELDHTVKAKQKEAAAAGKAPFFLKKSDKRKLELVAKFEALQSAGKLDRFMEKRRKHNASKDHRHLPDGRNDA